MSVCTRQTSLQSAWQTAKDKTQREEIGRDPKTAIPDCGESEEVSGTPSSNEPKVIRICSLNVDNLVTKISEPDFVSYVKSFDVFCAVETFTSTHFDFSTHFDNYHVFHSPAIKLSARGRRSGGVAAFIDKTFMPFITHIECGHDNMICIKISKDV